MDDELVGVDLWDRQVELVEEPGEREGEFDEEDRPLEEEAEGLLDEWLLDQGRLNTARAIIVSICMVTSSVICLRSRSRGIVGHSGERLGLSWRRNNCHSWSSRPSLRLVPHCLVRWKFLRSRLFTIWVLHNINILELCRLLLDIVISNFNNVDDIEVIVFCLQVLHGLLYDLVLHVYVWLYVPWLFIFGDVGHCFNDLNYNWFWLCFNLILYHHLWPFLLRRQRLLILLSRYSLLYWLLPSRLHVFLSLCILLMDSFFQLASPMALIVNLVLSITILDDPDDYIILNEIHNSLLLFLLHGLLELSQIKVLGGLWKLRHVCDLALVTLKLMLSRTINIRV